MGIHPTNQPARLSCACLCTFHIILQVLLSLAGLEPACVTGLKHTLMLEQVWRWRPGSRLEYRRNLTGHSGRVEAVAMDEAAGRAVSSGRDSSLKVKSAGGRALIGEGVGGGCWQGCGGRASSLKMSKAGKRALAG